MPAKCRPLATYEGLGGLTAQVVGPDGRLYLSYMYVDSTIELVAVDPETGRHEVLPNPAPTESGAWGLAVGSDGCIYLGTLPHAHLLRYNPSSRAYEDLGRPAPSESYIWALASGADGRMYGATYPSAKLVRFDPASGISEDLGRLDPEEMYARHIAAGRDGFVYIGIGTRRANIVAHEIATGERRAILPEPQRITGTARVWVAADGEVYAEAPGQRYHLCGWEAAPVATAPAAPPPRLADGRSARVEGGSPAVLRVWDTDGSLSREAPLAYRGRPVRIFRLCQGPEGALYSSTVLPLNVWRVDPVSGEGKDLGRHGGGECYTLLAHGGQVLMAAYAASGPLMALTPDTGTIRAVHFPGEDSAWRPQALVAGPDGRVYAGAVAGYGRLGCFLVAWDPGTDKVSVARDVVEEQAISSLAWSGNLLVGGTSVGGGGGSTPTRTDACLFLWDPVRECKVWEGVPVPGAGSITDLLTHPDGLVYGFAGTTAFAFNPVARSVVRAASAPGSVRGLIYNAVALRPDGQIWGCDSQGVFSLDPATLVVTRLAEAPQPVSAGFALDGDTVYFACGATVWRCEIAP